MKKLLPRFSALLLCVLVPFAATYAVSWIFGNIGFWLFVFFSLTACFSLVFYTPLFFVNTRVAFTAVFFVHSVIGYAILFYIQKYGPILDTSTTFSFFETTMLEVTEYTGSFSSELVSKPLVAYIAILLAGLFGAFKLSKNLPKKEFAKFVCAASIVFLLGLFTPYGRRVAMENVFVRAVNAHQMYNDELRRFKRQTKVPINEPVTVTMPHKGGEVHYVIIGESASRAHFGVYGYERDTTPKAKALGGELYAFDDVVSPHAHTIAVMKNLLTFEGLDKKIIFDQKGTLIQYIKAAGYKIFWISNHKEFGIEETLTSAMAKGSDVVYFLNDGENVDFDDSVVKKMLLLLETDPAEKKVFFLHFLGSHMKYDKRYPEKFNVFSGPNYAKDPVTEEIVNTYDNSILHTDYLVGKVIDKAKELNLYSSVLYLSDHGEDVFRTKADFLGHAENLSTNYMFDIPFMLWLSEKYKAENPDKTKLIAAAVHKPFQTDDFIYAYTDLLNISYPGFEKDKSLFNKDYKPKRRTIGGKEYIKK